MTEFFNQAALNVLQFPTIDRPPVVQTRRAGRYPKSVISLCKARRLAFSKQLEAKAKTDVRGTMIAGAGLRLDLITIEMNGDGTAHVEVRGDYLTFPELAVEHLRCIIENFEEHQGIDRRLAVVHNLPGVSGTAKAGARHES